MGSGVCTHYWFLTCYSVVRDLSPTSLAASRVDCVDSDGAVLTSRPASTASTGRDYYVGRAHDVSPLLSL